ncbi:hypothetical protein BHF71_10530 [Vulcanibacillus modesticaldus]|uniref:DUF4190 domain-containing protein n=1 Tax=Vulcanibacillus modesticaldus TaxID=337097 RepID=A0A1D2YTD4_9BACI|nr:DUF4190 domain-containing protein [Vulcanibacillus modesticaldus]OEF98954.1 hypothetical protein BHF71_10530 [Vulcanibacillus modesticaldus]
MTHEARQTNSKAIISLVIGILSIVIPYLGLIIGIIGIIYANKSIKEIENSNENGRGLAIAGKVCSIVGTVIYGILTLLLIFSFAIFNTLTSVG